MRLWLVMAAASIAGAQTADVAQGEKTFRTHCSPCHGLNGTGGRGPALNRGEFFHATTDADLMKLIAEGISGTEMPGIFYEEDRIKQIVAYVRTLNQSQRAALSGDPRRGAQLFRSKGCQQCHRIAGEGGRLGPDLSRVGMARSADHLRQSLLHPDADVRQQWWFVVAVEKNGSKLEGFLLNEDTYSAQILDFSEQLRSINKATLSSYRVEKTSKMPSYNGTSEKEIDDIVAYLGGLQ